MSVNITNPGAKNQQVSAFKNYIGNGVKLSLFHAKDGVDERRVAVNILTLMIFHRRTCSKRYARYSR
jgi:hypothetical protein